MHCKKHQTYRAMMPGANWCKDPANMETILSVATSCDVLVLTQSLLALSGQIQASEAKLNGNDGQVPAKI
jgi:hypothetical protein